MTMSEIKKIITNEVWTNENEYRVLNKYQDARSWAWENWDDDITRPFWEGNTKPDSETESFKENYLTNTDISVDFEDFLSNE